MRRVRILTRLSYHRDRDKILTKLVIFWGRGAFQGPSCTGGTMLQHFPGIFHFLRKRSKIDRAAGMFCVLQGGGEFPIRPVCAILYKAGRHKGGENAMKRTKGISLLAALLAGVCLGGAAADPVAHGSHQQLPLLLLMFVGKALRCVWDLFVHGSPLLFLSDIAIPQTPQTFQPAALFCSASCWQKGTRCYL